MFVDQIGLESRSLTTRFDESCPSSGDRFRSRSSDFRKIKNPLAQTFVLALVDSLISLD